MVNEHNFVAGDRRAGNELVFCVGKSTFHVQLMLGRTIVPIV